MLLVEATDDQGEAPPDVRHFLPRPGEPAEDYAARLRVLHEDLTLVLEAVERGLRAADPPTPATHAAPADPSIVLAGPEAPVHGWSDTGLEAPARSVPLPALRPARVEVVSPGPDPDRRAGGPPRRRIGDRQDAAAWAVPAAAAGGLGLVALLLGLLFG